MNPELGLEDVINKGADAPTSFMKLFNTEAETWCVSTLDYKWGLPVGTDFVTKFGDGASVFANINECIKQIESCIQCLENVTEVTIPQASLNVCQNDVCVQCIQNKEVCSNCQHVGHTSWHPELRACKCCLRVGVKCKRGGVLAHIMDCEEKNFQAIKLVNDKRAPEQSLLAQAIPDPPHRAKNLDQSAANWFLMIDGARFNRSMIRTLRNRETSVSSELSEVVTDRALRRRDRMDTSYVYDASSSIVTSVLQKVNACVQTLIPEPFRKCESNKVGTLEHPLGVTVGPSGILYVSDFTKGVVIRAKLHYPVEVEVIAKLCIVQLVSATQVECCSFVNMMATS